MVDSCTHTTQVKESLVQANGKIGLYKIFVCCKAFVYESVIFCANTPFGWRISFPPFVALIIAQYRVSPRPPCIAIYTIQYRYWQYRVKAK